MSGQKNPGHNSKRDFLKNPVEHIDITSFDSRKIISSMEKMSFVSRETANAANIYNEMLKDKDCTIFLTLAGSTSAAGCMNIYKDLVNQFSKPLPSLQNQHQFQLCLVPFL